MVYFGKASLLAFAAVACVAIHASPVNVDQSQNHEESADFSVRGICTRDPLGGSFQLIEPLTQDKTSPLFGQFAVNADGAAW